MKALHYILTAISGSLALAACSEAAPVDNPVATPSGGTNSVAGTGGSPSTSGTGGSVATTAGTGGTESAMAGTGPGTAGSENGGTGGSGGEPAQGGAGQAGGDGLGGTGGTGAEADTWTNYAEEFFVTYCVSCHNDDNLGDASRDYHVFSNVMGEQDVIACGMTKSEEDHTTRGCEEAPPARQFPPGNGPKPTDEERDRLIAWIDAGLPE